MLDPLTDDEVLVVCEEPPPGTYALCEPTDCDTLAVVDTLKMDVDDAVVPRVVVNEPAVLV